MDNNLQTLNERLFDTLDKLKDGKIKKEYAKVVNEIAGTIINNAKVQLDALKVTRGLGSQAEIFGVKSLEGAPKIGSKSLYQYKMEFSIFKKHDNVANCIASLGGNVHFDIEFRKWCKENHIDLKQLETEK